MDREQYDKIIQKTGDEIGPYAAVQVAKIIRNVVAPGKPANPVPPQNRFAQVRPAETIMHPTDFKKLKDWEVQLLNAVPDSRSKAQRRFDKRLAARRG
jgi:hypothetical protein